MADPYGRGISPASSLSNLSSRSSPRQGRESVSSSYYGGSRGNSPGPGESSGARIHKAIIELANEQERVQKKTFTNWMNSYLVKHDPPARVEDLFADVCDGVKLLYLLEVLSGEHLPKEQRANMKRLHFISNVTTALRFLESRRIKLVNINVSDIVDGKPSIILGLIWTIILYFQIEEHTRGLGEQSLESMGSTSSLASTESAPAPKKPKPSKVLQRGGARKTLLAWAQKTVAKKYGIEVRDFGRSWRDGHAFNAMIHSVDPELIDMEQLPRRTNKQNLGNAFNTAETHLGIPALLDPEDVDVEKPDEKSIMTYVAQFLEKYPDPDLDDSPSAKLEQARRMAEREQQEYEELVDWLHEADVTLQIVDRPVLDRHEEYEQFLAFQEELTQEHEVYKKFKQKADTKTFLVTTEEKWLFLNQRWNYVAQRTRVWQWKLDSNLPGRLGQLGDWLYRAEELVDSEINYAEKHEDTARNIHGRVEEHKVFFKDLDSVKTEFTQYYRTGVCDGVQIPQPQLESMNNRFRDLAVKEVSLLHKLEYEELKYRLLAFLVLAEAKLQAVQVKYGYQAEVEDMLADYQDFVHTRRLLEQYDATYRDCKQRADAYKKQESANSKEAQRVNAALEDVNERWGRVTVELGSVQTMLEEVVQYWKRYTACVDLFQVFLADAEKLVEKATEERQDFFKDLEKWEEKCKTLNESGNFLIEVVREAIAAEIKNQVLFTNKRFNDVCSRARQYIEQEHAQKSRSEYTSGIAFLNHWLDSTEALLREKLECQYPAVRDHLLKLEDILNEEQDVEARFKATSKTAQSLVKDSPNARVQEMLSELKVIKERLVLVRREIPEQMKPLKSLLSNVESLQIGITDLTKWLDEAEALLESHRLDGNINSVEDRLEKHTAFFKDLQYYKQMLESKNKVFQKVNKNGSRYINVRTVEKDMVSLNHRFQQCNGRSKEWLQKLEKCLQLWRSLQTKAQPVEDWVAEAETIMAQEGDDLNELITNHRAFFDHTNQRIFKDFLKVSTDLAQILDDHDRVELQQSIETLEERWKELLFHAPIRLMKLEFQGPEMEFLPLLGKAEQTLAEEETALQEKASVKEILRKHQSVFQESNLISRAEDCLDQMGVVSQRLHAYHKEDQSLHEAVVEYNRRWEELGRHIEDMRTQLEEVPERWREYNRRLEDFVEWMNGVEDTIAELEKESLSVQEYKDTLAKFEGVVKNIEQQKGDAKWLVKTLGELRQTTSEQEADLEQQRLDTILARYKTLMPAIEITTTRSSMVVRCYDFKEDMEKKTEWLKIAEEKLADELQMDDLAQVCVLLEEQEDILAQIERERGTVQARVAEGQALTRDENAPDFLQAAVTELDERFRDVDAIAPVKVDRLKQAVHNWEAYEGGRAQLSDFLRRAEMEASRHSPQGGQETVQKELAAKQELYAAMNDFQPELEKLKTLNETLQQSANIFRQRELQEEVSAMENRMQALSGKLTQRVVELQSADEKWTDFFTQLNVFNTWLSDKETQLKEIHQSEATPDQQFNEAKVVCSDIFDNHANLEQLETLGAELASGHRSRETSAVRSKLGNLRRVWEVLCSQAKERNQALSSDVLHWNQYQNVTQQMLPWLDSAERYLSEEVGKTSTADEAQQQFDHHQSFLGEQDEHQELYERLLTEASHLPDKPQVADDLKNIQARWSHMLMASEERTHVLQKALGEWRNFHEASSTLNQVIEKLSERVAVEPDLTAVEIDSLDRDYSAAKALKDEVRANEGFVQALASASKNLEPYLNPMGVSEVQLEATTLAQAWDDIRARSDSRSKVLGETVHQRKEFWDRWDDFEKWLHRTQRKMDSLNEIYSDEVKNAIRKLEGIEKECQEKEPNFVQMSADVEHLCQQCSPSEREHLSEQYKSLRDGFEHLQNLLDQRMELCDEWAKLLAVQKQVGSHVRALQQRLDARELSQRDVDALHAELEELHAGLLPWHSKKDELEVLITDAQTVIKDRPSQRTLRFGTEIQNMLGLFTRTTNMLEAKQGKLDQISDVGQQFEEQKANLRQILDDIKTKTENTKVTKHDLEGVKAYQSELKGIEKELASHSNRFEEFRELGRQLTALDPAKADRVNKDISEMDTEWETMQQRFHDNLTSIGAVISLWQQYNEPKSAVTKTLNNVTPVTEQDLVFCSYAEAKRALDQFKSAELDMQGQQRQFDYFSNRGKQLLQETKVLPGYNRQPMSEEIVSMTAKWNKCQKKLPESREAVEEQLVFWEQIQGGRDEIAAWLDSTVEHMEDSVLRFGDSANVQSQLHKYKNELPYFEEAFESLCRRMQTLQELNDNTQIASLSDTQQNLEALFAHASELVEQLDGQLSDFTGQREQLEGELQAVTQWLNDARDRLAKVDDVSGSDQDLLQRLNTAKTIHRELETNQGRIEDLNKKLEKLSSQYQSGEATALEKDISVLRKKYVSMTQKCQRVEENLENAIEAVVEEASLDQQRWITGAKEKVAWCSDVSGDKYSIEAKLATIQDLIRSVEQGQQKTEVMSEKVEMLKSASPKTRHGQLDKQKKQGEEAWKLFMQELQQTKTKLECNMEQLEGYDELYNSLSAWLKDTEARLRNEAGLKADLEQKRSQCQTFKMIQTDIVAHKPGLDSVTEQAGEISRNNADTRVATYAEQLNTRYKNAVTSVKNQLGKMEQNVEDHQAYLDSYRQACDWLKSAMDALELCVDSAGDKTAVQDRQDAVAEMIATKEHGQLKFDTAVENGEKLYLTTSTEGREAIRHDLRSLRDKWEGYSDSLAEVQRRLENVLTQWENYEDNYKQLEHWLKDMEHRVGAGPELKNTLQEKKSALQNYRALSHEIHSQLSIVDSLVDRGHNLDSAHTSASLSQLSNRHKALTNTTQEGIKHYESVVASHQDYADSYVQCREWLQTQMDKLDVCIEPSSDKHNIQNKLDRLQELIPTKQEGDNKVAAVKQLADKAISQTAAPGQQHIRREVETLSFDWQKYSSRLADAKGGLEGALMAWDEYDSLHDDLSKWLRDAESLVKDHELKSTLQDKRAQVDKYKALQQDLASKQPDVEDISVKAQNLQAGEEKMLSSTSQLTNRYDALKSHIKEMTSKWEDYASEHETYEANYASTNQWLNELSKRLQQCADTSGDRQIVEDRQAQLTELMAEKEQGAARMHETIEQGEKLYPNTASEGREIIRQQIRTLREKWEAFSDQSLDTQRQLEVCLLQLSSFEDNCDKFQSWLSETSVKVKLEADLKPTLQEKKLQLQNHKVQHHDILSHQHVLDSLKDRAKSLSTSDSRVARQLTELGQIYRELCTNSKAMLEKFELQVAEHQQYQDDYLDCWDMLTNMKQKLDSCSHTSGDKYTIQNKQERLQEFMRGLPDYEVKLKKMAQLCDKTQQNTSTAGKEMLKREMNNLRVDFKSLCVEAEDIKNSLEMALVQWNEFEEAHDNLQRWMQRIEQGIKDVELKSTLEEKATQLNKLKSMKTDIDSQQPDVDKYTDTAQALLSSSGDAKVSSYVSQMVNRYDALQSNVKELLVKWERFVNDHEAYRETYNDFTAWVTETKDKLDTTSSGVTNDIDALEQQKQQFQIVSGAKDEGFEKLNAAVEYGDKLYPDTAQAGREKIRQQLRLAKEVWDSLMGDMSEQQRQVDSALLQWTAYSEGAQQLKAWFLEIESTLRGGTGLKDTLQEKRVQLQTNKSVLQDITSHNRAVESALEKANTIVQHSHNEEVENFSRDTSEKYHLLFEEAKKNVAQCEQNVLDHTQYQENYQSSQEWLNLMCDRLKMCADVTGDKHALTNKLERTKDLSGSKSEGSSKITNCEKLAMLTTQNTAAGGKQIIEQDMNDLKQQWLKYVEDLVKIQENLQSVLARWVSYEETNERLAQWIKSTEKKLKDFSLVATLDDKKTQVTKYQAIFKYVTEFVHEIDQFSDVERDLLQDIKACEREVDGHNDETQSLTQLSAENRLASYVLQIQTRYQALQTTSKDILRKCEMFVAEHEDYNTKYTTASKWVEEARSKYATCETLSNSIEDLQTKQTVVQEIIRDKDSGFEKLTKASEAGDKLYPSTAADGRELIRSELRRLKAEWDSLYDEVLGSQRNLEVSLVQWTSFEESYDQLEAWLKNMEGQLAKECPLLASIEEKKTQLQTYRNLSADVLSYQRVLDGVLDKAHSLAKASTDPRLTQNISQMSVRYKKLCESSKDHVTKYEAFVKLHQQYQTALSECQEWLATMQERLQMADDMTGDRHTVQNRLDRLQDVNKAKSDGEPKIEEVVSQSKLVLPSTSPRGCDIIKREVDGVEKDWENLLIGLEKTEEDLTSCVQQWIDYEEINERVTGWLKDVDTELRNVDLKATQEDKLATLQHIKALHEDLNNRETELDELTDKAQALSRISADGRLASHASQCATRYQTLSLSLKELLRRWEQIQMDHQNYEEAYHNCTEWQKDIASKLKSYATTDGDKIALHNKLSKLQELFGNKEEGFHRLQQVVDQAHLVLPNTSPPGKDIISDDLHGLRQDWDDIIAMMNDGKSRIETAVSQWEVHDDAVTSLTKWLLEMETTLKGEGELQSTLPEKRSQLERVKVLSVNIASQQVPMKNLKERSQSLTVATKDSQLNSDVSHIIKRNESISESAKDLLQKCQLCVNNHQQYQDLHQDARDWLNNAQDKLITCADVRGDRHSLEAKRQKVEDLVATRSVGETKLSNVQDRGQATVANTAPVGQDIIRDELHSLSEDFNSWVKSVGETSSHLEKLLNQWNEYDRGYEQLSHWLKDIETKVKVATELQPSLPEKKALYNKYKDYNEEVKSKQTEFDGLSDRTQMLLQSSSDSRITAQLTQLNSRYTALLAFTKDTVKKLDQHVDDHQQYKEAHTKCSAWLTTMRDRLASCADTGTSADKEGVQDQLEKLHDFIVLKEEGQTLMHAANTWGEKTLATTSPDGREVIHRELQTLQHSWDAFVSSISDTRMALESQLLQWSEFDDSFEQIQRWLKDMERRTADPEPKADLGEKRAQLQKVKGLYQDIIAYEHMIDSAKGKAQELTIQSPRSRVAPLSTQVVMNYMKVKEKTKDLVAKHERDVEYHRALQESCNHFNTWMRLAREKLATCSDTYGDKITVQGKMDKVKAIQQTLPEATGLVSKVREASNKVMASTSKAGQARIKQETGAIVQDFEDFKSQLNDAHNALDNCLSRWDTYEQAHQAFSEWLTEQDGALRRDLEPQATLLDMEQQYAQYQVIHQNIASHQSEMDTVSQKGQDLLETNSDARISHSITQLTTKYQALVSASKELQKRLEGYCTDMRRYQHAQDDFESWLDAKKQQLQESNSTDGSKDDVESRLSKVRELQGQLDFGHGKLRLTSDLADKVVPNASTAGAREIRENLEQNRSEFDKLKQELGACKQELESVVTHWSTFERSFEQLNNWVKDTEMRLKSDSDLKTDLAEKKAQCEKIKMLKKDVAQHQGQMDGLTDKASQLHSPLVQDSLSDLSHRYEALRAASEASAGRLEQQVAEHGEYRQRYRLAMDWVIATRQQLTQLSDASGSKDEIEAKQEKLRNAKESLPDGQTKYRDTEDLGEKVKGHTSAAGCERIEQDMQLLKEEYGNLNGIVTEVAAALQTSITGLEEFMSEQAQFISWLEASEEKVKAKAETFEFQAPQQLETEFESIQEDIARRKPNLESLTEKSEAVLQKTGDPSVSSNMMQLATRYQALQSSTKESSKRLGEFLRHEGAYRQACAACRQWQDAARARLTALIHRPVDLNLLHDKLDTVKELQSTLEEGLQYVNHTYETSQKLMPRLKASDAALVAQETDAFQAEHRSLQAELSSRYNELDGQLDTWRNYNELEQELAKWLAEVESLVVSGMEPKSELMEKKAQLERFKGLYQDLESHRSSVAQLEHYVTTLESHAPENQEPRDRFDDLDQRYKAAMKQIQESIGEVDKAFQAQASFRDRLQECEKWVLQLSFKLMAHNTLNVATPESTQEQMEKHEELVAEIEDYSERLGSVAAQSEELKALPTTTSQLAQQLESQISNLHESYNSLKTTANQIKERLLEISERWRQYSGVLEECGAYLAEEAFPWLEAQEQMHASELHAASHLTQTVARETLDTLLKYKQEINSSRHRCENLGSLENLAVAVQVVDSPLTQTAAQVTTNLDLAIEQVENRLSQIRDMTLQWEAVDHLKDDFAAWLTAKAADIARLDEKPEKLHLEAAQLEIQRLEELKAELQSKDATLNKISQRYSRLSPSPESTLAENQVEPLRETWLQLLEKLDSHLRTRRAFLEKCAAYHSRHGQVDEQLSTVSSELLRVHNNHNVPVRERARRIQPQIPTARKKADARSSGTQTPSSSTRAAKSPKRATFAETEESRIPRPLSKRGVSPSARARPAFSQSPSPSRSKIPRPISTSSSRNSSPERAAKDQGGSRSGVKPRRQLPAVERRYVPPLARSHSPPRRRPPAEPRADRRSSSYQNGKKRKYLHQDGEYLSDSDAESGYGETLYAPSSDQLLSHELPSGLSLSYQRGAGQQEPSGVLPRTRRLSADSKHSKNSNESENDNVLQAILEADRAMQEMMENPHTQANGELSRNLDEWIRQRRTNLISATENGEPVRVLLLDENQTTSLTDSIKQALKKASDTDTTRRQSGGGYGEMGNRRLEDDVPQSEPRQSDANLLRLTVYHHDDDEDDDDGDVFGGGVGGERVGEEMRSPSQSYRSHSEHESRPRSRQSSLHDQRLRRGMEILEHEMKVNKHIFKPNTDFSDSLEEDRQAFSDRDNVVSDEDRDIDMKSWHSGVTEPEPISGSVLSIDAETQTLRHRTTQTVEHSATQTNKHFKRRKLPTLPTKGRSSDDMLSSEATTGSSDSYESEPVRDQSEQKTKVSERRTHARKKMRQYDPHVISSSTMSGEIQNPHLTHSISEPIDPRLSFPDEGQLRHRSAPIMQQEPRVSRDNQPKHAKQYQQYTEAFNGAASGPFVPHLNQASLDESVLLDEGGQQTGRVQDRISVPRYMPRDSRTGIQHSTSPPFGRGQPLTHSRVNIPDEMAMNRAFDNLQSASDPLMMRPNRTNEQSWDVFTSDDQAAEQLAQSQLQHPRNFDQQSSRRPQGHPAAQTPRRFGGEYISPDTLRSPVDEQRYYGRRDFNMQTPGFQATQTPIRLQLDPNGTRFQAGTLSLGDTYVIDSDGRTFIQPWSQLGPRDLASISLRDFSTQTFGQMQNHSNKHAETQTNVTDFTPQSDFNQQTDAALPSAAAAPTQSHSPPVRDQVVDDDDIFSERPQTSARKPKKKREKRSKSGDRVSEAQTEKSMSRKDILRYMLMQVRSLRTELDPKGEFKPAKKDAKERKKHKSSKAKPFEEGIVGSQVDVGEGEYARRRLALLYHTPRGDAESRSRPRRRHSIESLLTDRDYRERSQSRDRYSRSYRPRSRDGSLFRRRRDYVPMRRAYTPPSRWERDYSPPSVRDRDYTPPSFRDREYSPHSARDRDCTPPRSRTSVRSTRRRLPPAPPRDRYPRYPPSAQIPRMLPQPPPYASMPAPPPVQPTVTFAPPPVQVIPPQLGQGAFRPPVMNTAPVMPQPHAIPVYRAPAPVVVNRKPVTPEPRYIVVTSPNKTDNKSRSRSRSKQKVSSSGSDLEASLYKANKAIHEMKVLTRRMAEANQ